MVPRDMGVGQNNISIRLASDQNFIRTQDVELFGAYASDPFEISRCHRPLERNEFIGSNR
jgi:hypothetical protein